MSSEEQKKESDDELKGKAGTIAAWAKLIGAFAALAAVIWGPDLTGSILLPPQTLTPIVIVTETSPVSVSSPTLSGSIASPRPADTQVPAPLPSSPCLWQAYNGDTPQPPNPESCLSDGVFGDIGISDLGNGKVDFLVSNNHAGIYGMVLALGPVQQIKNNFKYTVHLTVKELTAGQIFLAFSPKVRPDVASAYAIVVTPIESKLVTKYFFYNADGIPNQYVFSEKPAINTAQGVDYTIQFSISYPNLSIDVNNGGFRPKTEQICFSGAGYIFIGYQRISSETARTRIRAEAQLP